MSCAASAATAASAVVIRDAVSGWALAAGCSAAVIAPRLARRARSRRRRRAPSEAAARERNERASEASRGRSSGGAMIALQFLTSEADHVLFRAASRLGYAPLSHP